MSRAPSVPPVLDGYRVLGVLGSGGFADVFSYEQQKPVREVAVKVLLRDLAAEAQRHFESEANLMAKLSNHPSIVSIYSAGQAPDGRPYLVMEMCQPGHLGRRIAQRPYQVGKALEIGIQIAGAVETAHRLGILHRDIKPGNILFTEYGRAALTDFGISVTESGGPASTAFSVAWAPPEQIAGQSMSPAGDVYSLAATVWAMLGGHSPFDKPGENETFAHTHRVRTLPVPVTGRRDVPESLEGVLRTAMAKRPELRYASALEFARALQGVQAELHQSVTTIDVREDRSVEDALDETETGTRVTGFLSVDPETPDHTDQRSIDWGDSHGTRPTDLTSDSHGTSPTDLTGDSGLGGRQHPVLGHGFGAIAATDPLDFTGPAIPQVPGEDTYLVSDLPRHEPASPSVARSRRRFVPLLVGAGTLATIGVLGVSWILNGGGAATTGGVTSGAPRPMDAVAEQVAGPVDGKAVRKGDSVVVTWRNPSSRADDTFLYRPLYVDREVAVQETTTRSVTVPAQVGRTCVEVTVVRADGVASDPTPICLDS